MHHGIKGQKWGVRRYQNEDGGLTPEGRKRYGDVYSHREEKYTNKANRLQKRVNKNRLMSSLNRHYSEHGPKLLSGVYKVNEKYYNKKAEKISKKVDKAKSNAAENRKRANQKFNEFSNSKNGKELAKRGKSALDVLLNGDQDWMGRSLSSDNPIEEGKNRAKAALERIMYSDEQVNNKKFYGKYNPFD